ncbi:MAG: tetratricopeptide repeat protein [Elusimicrobiota bacterium]
MNKKSIIMQLLLLAFFTFLIYSNTINGEFLFDDEHFIVRNPYIRDWSCIKDIFFTNVTSGIGFKDNFYRPLSIFVWLIINKTFGLNPVAFHLTNIFIHISCGILIYLLLQKLFKSQIASFIGSAFFLANPLNTEIISYASGTGDILSFGCLLLAIFAFLKIYPVRNEQLPVSNRVNPTLPEKPLRKGWVYYTLFCISTILAILAKERAIMMIFLLPLLEISFLNTNRRKMNSNVIAGGEIPRLSLRGVPLAGRRSNLRTELEQAPQSHILQFATYGFLILVVAAWFFLRLTVFNFQNSFNFYQTANIYSQNLSVRIFTFFHSFLVYLKLLLIPYPLYMERTIPVFTYFLQPKVLFGFFLLIIGLILAIRSFNKKRIFFFSYFWFLIALAPTSGIIPVNALIMEHWLYFSLFGISVLIASWVNSRPTLKNIFLFCILIWGGLTFYQNRVWKNPYIFFQHILKYNPDSVAANNNFAMALVEKGELDKSIYHYKKAISLSDTFSQPHHNLARIYIAKNDLRNAIDEYNRALEIDPNFVFTHQDLANIWAQLGEKQKAEYHQRRVTEILKK